MKGAIRAETKGMGQSAAAQANTARKFDLEVIGTAKDLGELQYNVLLAVSEKRYADAISHLRNYKNSKGSYPLYAKKTDPLFKHAEDLVNAIEAKKNFPNLHSLAQSRQEEIHQKAMENWEALKVVLRRLRTLERDMAAADARSSIWVIKALVFSSAVLLFIFVVNEAFISFGKSFPMFIDELVQEIMNTLTSFFQF